MERAQGIIVRGTDWSETSRIATLFTREFGKIRVLAKGGRRLKSNYEVALDLLGVCDVVFIRKAHGGLDLLTEARVAERFPALRTDLRKLNAGYYLAELLSDGTQDYDPHPELYDAAIGTLRALGTENAPYPLTPFPEGKGEQESDFSPFPLGKGARGLGDPITHVCRFELVWLRELGYTPRLDACASCGTAGPVPLPNGRILVGPQAGGVMCPNCRMADRDTRSLSPDAFEGFVGLVNGAGDVTPETRGELRALIGQMVCVTLGRRPKLLTYVDGG